MKQLSTPENCLNSVNQLIAKYQDGLSCPTKSDTHMRRSKVQLFLNRICLTINEFAVQSGLSPKSVERLIKRKELQVRRVGRRVLIPMSAIEAWLNEKE